MRPARRLRRGGRRWRRSRARAGHAGSKGRPQRPCPWLGQEIQALPRQTELILPSRGEPDWPSIIHPEPGELLPVKGRAPRRDRSRHPPRANRRDLTVIELSEGSRVAGVFTQNRFCAAPVQVCRHHLAGGRSARCSSTPASPAPGEDGPGQRQCLRRAGACNWRIGAGVLPFSTGVILEPLPVDRLVATAARRSQTCADGWFDAAHAATTDTLAKAVSRQVRIGGARSPSPASAGRQHDQTNMATMLGFLACDARRSRRTCSMTWRRRRPTCPSTASPSMATPTNDSFILIATGAAGKCRDRRRRQRGLPRPARGGDRGRGRARAGDRARWRGARPP